MIPLTPKATQEHTSQQTLKWTKC